MIRLHVIYIMSNEKLKILFVIKSQDQISLEQGNQKGTGNLRGRGGHCCNGFPGGYSLTFNTGGPCHDFVADP